MDTSWIHDPYQSHGANTGFFHISRVSGVSFPTHSSSFQDYHILDSGGLFCHRRNRVLAHSRIWVLTHLWIWFFIPPFYILLCLSRPSLPLLLEFPHKQVIGRHSLSPQRHSMTGRCRKSYTWYLSMYPYQSCV